MRLKIFYCIFLFIVCTSCIKTSKYLIYESEGKKQKTEKIGVASWYGKKFHNRKTANGEIYNMNGISAAHKELPFGTIVRVTNLKNGKSVDVRINDRGPYKKGRIIDLSYGAAKKIDMVKTGTTKVRLEIIKSTLPVQNKMLNK